MPVPKTACTSIKTALAVVDPAVPASTSELVANPKTVHKIYSTRRFRLHRWRAYDGWWRFAVLRDPLARLLSAYADVVIGRNGLRDSPRIRAAGHELPVAPDPDFFFQNLAAYRDASSLVKHHVLPARIFVGPDLSRFDRVYRIEELPDLANDLSYRVGKKVTFPRINKSAGKLRFSGLKPTTRDAVRDYLAADYALFAGYYPDATT